MRPVIIYPPTIDWDYLHQRPQQLLKALACQGCISIFCNINKYKLYSNGFEYLSESLVLANSLPYNTVVEWGRKVYPSSPLVAYFTYPPHINQVLQQKTDLIVFDSVDEPSHEFASWLPSYAAAAQNSDVIIASSSSLVKRSEHDANHETYLIPNGCDFEHFQFAQTRRQIDCEPFQSGKPVIGYIGALAPWLDWRLLNTMIHYLPDYEFVFIGPRLMLKSIVFASSNMYYLGHKSYADLPVYLSNFNYSIIPFKLTNMTKGVNPIKLWEYLASGHPILSTPLPEIPQEYVSLITEDMFPGFSPEKDDTGREKRISLARRNSWEERGKRFLEIINSKLQHG